MEDWKAARRSLGSLVWLALVAGCGDDPMQIELQVIEEVEFASSLGIDLETFTELPSGVYVQDVVVGTGDPAQVGDQVEVRYARHFWHGQLTQTGSFGFTLGDAETIVEGLHQGIPGMRVGGERRIIVPPELGYGVEGLVQDGRLVVPGGWILIFDITLNAVN